MVLRAIGGLAMLATLNRKAPQGLNYSAGTMIIAASLLLGYPLLSKSDAWTPLFVILVFGPLLAAIPLIFPMRRGLEFGRPYIIVRKTPPIAPTTPDTNSPV